MNPPVQLSTEAIAYCYTAYIYKGDKPPVCQVQRPCCYTTYIYRRDPPRSIDLEYIYRGLAYCYTARVYI